MIISLLKFLAEKLSIKVQLDVEKANIKKWVTNEDGIRQQLGSGLCQAFQVPDKTIEVDSVEEVNAILNLFALPPHGKSVVNILNGSAADAVERMKAIRQCCRALDINIQSITLGEFDLKIEDKLMDPRWNKTYVWPNEQSEDGQYWKDPINRGGKPYYCPSGE